MEVNFFGAVATAFFAATFFLAAAFFTGALLVLFFTAILKTPVVIKKRSG
jgi:hypothetical protein